jgi:hypothetical protein
MAELWERVNPLGKAPTFKTDKALWNKCVEYFQWIKDNPLFEEKVFCNQGEVTKTDVQHPRAMTIAGLCVFLNINNSMWREWRRTGRYPSVIKHVDEIIYSQKFEGAAAGMFNPNIIARDLGLVDKKESDHKSTDGSMTPQPTTIQVVALEPDSKDSASA